MRQIILFFSIILLFPTDLYSQCVKGDCQDGLGTKVRTNNIKYVGEFKDGEYHGEGSLSYITYSEAQNDLYFKSEKIVFEGIFEMGSWKKGKRYGEDGTTIIYDGEYSIFDNIYNRHGNGLLYIDGVEYDLEFHKDSYEYFINQYSRDDILGDDDDNKIKLRTRDGGLNEIISVEINGTSFDYVYDTGAEVLDISPSLEKELLNQNIITQKDYYPSIISVDANGDETLVRRVKISGVKIGNYIVNNVVVTINNDDSQPLLFGRTILNKKFNNKVSWRPGQLTLYK